MESWIEGWRESVEWRRKSQRKGLPAFGGGTGTETWAVSKAELPKGLVNPSIGQALEGFQKGTRGIKVPF